TIGALFGSPRTATGSFTGGLAPLVAQQYQQVALFGFSALFSLAAFLLSYKENNIASNLGTVLNAVFLVFLFFVFLVSVLTPMASVAQAAPTAQYLDGAFTNGFLEGYNTMDALSGLAFGVTVVTAVRAMGKKREKSVAAVTAKAAFFSMSAVAV